MPALKRQRAQLYEDDEEQEVGQVVNVESAQSSLRQDNVRADNPFDGVSLKSFVAEEGTDLRRTAWIS